MAILAQLSLILKGRAEKPVKYPKEVQKHIILYLSETNSTFASTKLPEEVLAYLWLAIDSGMNIVVTGKDEAASLRLLSQISWLIDRLDHTMILENGNGRIIKSGSHRNLIFLYGTKYIVKDSAAGLKEALNMDLERIVLDKLNGNEAAILFNNAALGRKFLTSMTGSYSANEIIETFFTKPSTVNSEHLSMLDLSINLEKERGIFEYRWLSRAEISEGNILKNGDSVKISKIFSVDKVNAEALKGSKVIENFAYQNGISIRYALSEYETRKKILSNIISLDPYLFNLNISSYLSRFMI